MGICQVGLLPHPLTCPKVGVAFLASTYTLDTETKGSTVFRNPRALGCSSPSAARALLRARGFLNTVDPVGRGV